MKIEPALRRPRRRAVGDVRVVRRTSGSPHSSSVADSLALIVLAHGRHVRDGASKMYSLWWPWRVVICAFMNLVGHPPNQPSHLADHPLWLISLSLCSTGEPSAATRRASRASSSRSSSVTCCVSNTYDVIDYSCRQA